MDPIVRSLLSKPFVLAAQAVNLALIFITLDSLSFLLSLLSHQLITDQRADCGVANGAANDRSRSSPDSATLHPRRRGWGKARCPCRASL